MLPVKGSDSDIFVITSSYGCVQVIIALCACAGVVWVVWVETIRDIIIYCVSILKFELKADFYQNVVSLDKREAKNCNIYIYDL